MLLRIALQFANPTPQAKQKPSASGFPWILRLLYIMFSFGFGVALLCLPWQGYWENNDLLYRYPELRPLIANSFFKGAVLGLGIANLLIGVQEIAHFKGISKGHSR